MILMNSDKKNGISISITNNCNYNVVIQSQTSTSRSIYSPKSETRKRCYVCVSNAYDPGYKKSKANTQASKNRCQKCGTPVCCNHILKIGPECQKLAQGAQFYKIVTFYCFLRYLGMLFLAHVVYSIIGQIKN